MGPNNDTCSNEFPNLRCNNLPYNMFWQFPQAFLQIWSTYLVLKSHLQPWCRGVEVSTTNSRRLNYMEERTPRYPLGGLGGKKRKYLFCWGSNSDRSAPKTRQLTDSIRAHQS